MMIHATTTGRFLITSKDISHAKTASGEIDHAKLSSHDLAEVHDAPTYLIAQVIAIAACNLTSGSLHAKHKAHLPEALVATAEQAALERDWCLEHHSEELDKLSFPHFYETDQSRYAISKNPITVCSDCRRAGMIRESHLTDEERANTCFFSDSRLAVFLHKATGSSFDVKASSHAHFVHKDNKTLLLDGNETTPIDEISRTASLREQLIHLSAAEFQHALAKTYHTAAEAVKDLPDAQ